MEAEAEIGLMRLKAKEWQHLPTSDQKLREKNGMIHPWRLRRECGNANSLTLLSYRE